MAPATAAPTLVVRYAAPLMSFGGTGRFNVRPTELDPTPAAIQGMLAAAAGIPRRVLLPEWIADLELTIRIERAGRPIKDFHTVNPPDLRAYRHLSDKDRNKIRTVTLADGGRRIDPVVTERWYLTDAAFTLFIHDPERRAEQALLEPVWAYYAGRKGCPLTEPIVIGRTNQGTVDALEAIPTAAGPSDSDATHPQRRAITFTEDPRFDRYEDRDDRLVTTGRHHPQRRWYLTVRPSAVPDTDAVADHLAEQEQPT